MLLDVNLKKAFAPPAPIQSAFIGQRLSLIDFNTNVDAPIDFEVLISNS